MSIREIDETEVHRLSGCLTALAAHHNAVSVNFKGSYPSKPDSITMANFVDVLRAGTARIAVKEIGQAVVGFCKVDIRENRGTLDYLAVLPEYRGNGYGSALMDWAMAVCRENGVAQIEVKVVDGNPAIRLYEKYGFRMNAHILRCADV